MDTHFDMRDERFGFILDGSLEILQKSYEVFIKQEVDWDMMDEQPAPIHRDAKTIDHAVEVSAPGTFWGKEIRNLKLEPTEKEGWWLNRADLPESQPVKVSIRNVWTTGDVVSNIVLRSGSSHNYVRLVEHIIALKAGMDVDNLVLNFEASGDPPLFKKGSLDLVDALNEAGRKDVDGEVKYFTVKEKVSIVREDGSFLIIEPAEDGRMSLDLDCAVDFPTAIGKQRIKFPLNENAFSIGCQARTNTSFSKMLFCKTIGQLFADIRNLGYNKENVLIAKKNSYWNEPALVHDGKCLESVWHRAILDLLAAIALIDEGRFVGKITSYKAGHFLDVEMVRLLSTNDFFVEIT